MHRLRSLFTIHSTICGTGGNSMVGFYQFPHRRCREILRTANASPRPNVLATLRHIVGPAEEVSERRIHSFAHDGRHSPLSTGIVLCCTTSPVIVNMMDERGRKDGHQWRRLDKTSTATSTRRRRAYLCRTDNCVSLLDNRGPVR